MKRYLLVAIIVLATNAMANEMNDLFTANQKNNVLQQIDNICADTWCEGDFNFRFNNFTCDKKNKSCTLDFQFIKTDDNNTEIYSPVQFCHFEKIASIKQLLESNDQLNDNFYESLTDCITDLEGSWE